MRRGRGVRAVRNSTLRLTLRGLVIIAILIAAGHGPAAAAYTATMPVADLAPGMKGYGLTVFSGVEPEPFDVEVLAVSPRGASPGSMILIRASGPNMEAAGGVAEGMSGSPVYIDDKLIGAIAYVFPGSDHFVAGVTPIADMLRMLEYSDSRAASAAGWFGSVDLFGQPGALDSAPLAAGATMYVSGASPRALESLSAAVAPRGIKVMPASASLGGAARAAVAAKYRLAPGAMVAMQLATGDIEVSVYGSVTYVDGGRFVAFGHPVLSSGAVDLAAAGAIVHTVVRSDDVPFKVASSLAGVGAFTQDRLYGAAGRLGAQARMIPVTIAVSGGAAGAGTQLESMISNSELLVADLFSTVAMGGVDHGLDRLGQGTATVNYVVEIEGHDALRRSDTVWSDSDISYAAVAAARRALGLIVGNAVEQAQVKSVSLNVDVEVGRRTAKIVKASALEPVVAPGGLARIEVTLRQFRGALVTRVVEVEIPEDMPEGPVSFVVKGGGASDEDEGDLYGPDDDDMIYMDMEELLAELRSAPRGDEIVVQMEDYFYDYDDTYMDEGNRPRGDAEAEGPASGAGAQAPELHNQPRGDTKTDGAQAEGDSGDAGVDGVGAALPGARLLTDWFIHGITWVDMEIAAAGNSAAAD